jgi:hypothetical protein
MSTTDPLPGIIERLVELDVEANVRGLRGRRETISARLGRRMFERKATAKEAALCQLLEILEPDHCLKAYARAVDAQPAQRRHRADDRALEEEIYTVLSGR